MVVVPAGEFLMGSPTSEKGRGKDEGPQHKVTFAQPFAVGKFEVTFAQWDACVAEGGCTHKPGDETWGRGKRPVINVSWDDAKQFVAWLAKKTGKPYRLLTEAEWEYAARGADQGYPTRSRRSRRARPSTTSRPTTTPISPTARVPQGIYRQKTLDVGSLPRNAFGLHDMHGNVWEWVEDCYKDSYAGAPDGRLGRQHPPTAACTSCAAAPGTTTPSCCVLPIAMPPLPASARKMRASALQERCDAPVTSS